MYGRPLDEEDINGDAERLVNRRFKDGRFIRRRGDPGREFPGDGGLDERPGNAMRGIDLRFDKGLVSFSSERGNWIGPLMCRLFKARSEELAMVGGITPSAFM